MAQEDIVRLREETSAGVMDCKKALEDAGGDVEKAKQLIFERGFAKAEKKGGRELKAGYLEAYVHSGRIGVLLEMGCETDFVAKNEKFRELAHEIAMQIASMDPETVEDVLKQPFIKDAGITVSDLIAQAISTIGENIKIERFCRYEI
jgi:elongation factor Ts